MPRAFIKPYFLNQIYNLKNKVDNLIQRINGADKDKTIRKESQTKPTKINLQNQYVTHYHKNADKKIDASNEKNKGNDH